jgi:hypothetical protein
LLGACPETAGHGPQNAGKRKQAPRKELTPPLAVRLTEEAEPSRRGAVTALGKLYHFDSVNEKQIMVLIKLR